MQYLSKAYNYYSGINPATLSGAIDVIVVRHVDENGETTLSSSPFHVRFGKLQVLRAGEKRVTLHLPNNLPAPHTAPFSMKVVETGEAFFVFETEEEVPAELLTSPVVMPEDSGLPPTPPPSDPDFLPPSYASDSEGGASGEAGPSLTQQPFGATEQVIDHNKHDGSVDIGKQQNGVLGEVDFLDLNDASTPDSMDISGDNHQASEARENPIRKKSSDSLSALASAVSPSSLLNTATSLLPSIPFLSTPPSSSSTSPKKDKASMTKLPPTSETPPSDIGGDSSSPDTSNPSHQQVDPVPNPMTAQPGESTEMPEHDRKLSDLDEHEDTRTIASQNVAAPGSTYENQAGDEKLPKVKAGEGEGPKVIYGKDIVMDMGGYHAQSLEKAATEREAETEAPLDELHGKGLEIINLNDLPEARAEKAQISAVDTDIQEGEVGNTDHSVADAVKSTGLQSSLVETFAHDLLASAKPPFDPSLGLSRPSTLVSRQTDPNLPISPRSDVKKLPIPISATAPEAPKPDLTSSIASLSLESDHPEILSTPTSSPARRSRYERGQSEPPESMRDLTPSSAIPIPQRFPLMPGSPSRLSRTPNGTLIPTMTGIHAAGSHTDMDYAWDWGRFPGQSGTELSEKQDSGDVDHHVPLLEDSRRMERSTTNPVSPSKLEETKNQIRTELYSSAGLDLATTRTKGRGLDSSQGLPGKLKNVEEDPYLFVFEMEGGRSHTFELALCGTEGFAPLSEVSDEEETIFLKNRVTFQKFIEDPHIVDDPRLVIRYSLLYLTWTTGYRLLFALAMYRRSLTPPSLSSVPTTLPSLAHIGVDPAISPRPSSGYGWSRWWRRGQSGATGRTEPPQVRRQSAQLEGAEKPPADVVDGKAVVTSQKAATEESLPALKVDMGNVEKKHYAKTLRLTSDQLKQLNLKPGPNTVQFSVTSSYSGLATCSARIFLWEETDQVVISDIDGTITKSDALGHVFAAIGRDWTHLGIAKLYTDICNNGYKILYLTSRAIGQADSTREYLKSINQGDYRLPEGPVIMSPDRLMASLHREVIMRKPELFKMACLRDIQRLFGSHAKEAFFAGFGNRITDAMSYRSVGIETSKIYTIDSTGTVKTELLQAAGHKGSYIQLNDLVNEVFPIASTKIRPEYTDFNFWRPTFPEINLPDLAPPSPALSARSDTSGRLSVLGKIAGIGRRTSRQPLLPTTNPNASVNGDAMSASSRPSSPLIGPAMTPDELSENESDNGEEWEKRKRQISMPGSFEEGDFFPESYRLRGEEMRRAEEGIRKEREEREEEGDGDGDGDEEGDEGRDGDFDDEGIFDDDLLATGEMRNVPF